MTVYVTELRVWGKWRFGASCHLMADTPEELHEFAAAIGLRRSWFQDGEHPHYDLTTARRARAVRSGAVETTARARLTALRELRSSKC